MLPVANKSFYPEPYQDKTRLQYYASVYNSLEVNQTFYKMPRETTMERWASEVPQVFRFSVKMPKWITHAKGLVFERKDVIGFMRSINVFGITKGCLLIQFLGGTRVDSLKKMTQLLTLVDRVNHGWQLAVEFRHTSWYTDKIYALLEKLNAGLVLHDIPASVTPPVVLRSTVSYYRFHGIAGDYRGTYSDALLHQYAQRIQQNEADGKTVYAYFNNTLGDAAFSVLRLQHLCPSAD